MANHASSTKGLVIGAIIGTLVTLVGMTSSPWFVGMAFGGGIGFLIGLLASRRDKRLAPDYPGPNRRASIARYQGIDRRTH